VYLQLQKESFVEHEYCICSVFCPPPKKRVAPLKE
jgi:hypothetical protein